MPKPTKPTKPTKARATKATKTAEPTEPLNDTIPTTTTNPTKVTDPTEQTIELSASLCTSDKTLQDDLRKRERDEQLVVCDWELLIAPKGMGNKATFRVDESLPSKSTLTVKLYRFDDPKADDTAKSDLGTEGLQALIWGPAAIDGKKMLMLLAHRRPPGAIGSMPFLKTKSKVSNRGVPPDSFLQELVGWGRTALSEIFEDKTTKEPDVYASVKGKLGPYVDGTHRKACMLEVMRVLAGFESSWKFNEGRDVTNKSSVTPDTIEAGAWQVSANSLNFGQDLKDLVSTEVGTLEGDPFQQEMKANHPLAMEYIARLLRHTCRHNGPVLRHEIDPFLSPEAVNEFQQLLTT